MAEITVDFASRMIAASERGEHSPLTINEENQLAYAWLCLDMLRRLVKDGHTIGAVALLADPAAMAAAYRAEYREDGEQK